jgi:hypothetical protein
MYSSAFTTSSLLKPKVFSTGTSRSRAPTNLTNACIGEREADDVRHLVLRRLGQETDHRDHAAESDGLDGPLDRAGAAVLEDVVYTAAAGDLLGFRRPLGGGLVVDGVVHAVFGPDVRELLVAARRDGLCAGGSGQDKSGDGNTTSACRMLAREKTSICVILTTYPGKGPSGQASEPCFHTASSTR